MTTAAEVILFGGGGASNDIVALTSDATRSARRGDHRHALGLLVTALGLGHCREEEYAPAAAAAARTLAALGDDRGALSASWYASPRDDQRTLFEHAPPADRARTFALWAAGAGADALEMHDLAASEFERAGLAVQAALHRERAGDLGAARALWSRFADALAATGADHYAAGLAWFNVARTSLALGDAKVAESAAVKAVHLIEAAADDFETRGQRERAFDCYQVLVALGRRTGAFEHVLEGAVNAIRVLAQDHLFSHALSLSEHAIDLAEEAGEYAAGASLALDMANLAASARDDRARLRATEKRGTLYELAAESVTARSGPPELAENALLESIRSHAAVGQWSGVRRAYGELIALAQSPERRAAHERSLARYEKATDAPGAHVDGTRSYVEPPDVWIDDLVEWEARGSAADACADVLLGVRGEADAITRRAALLGRLTALACDEVIAGEGRGEGAPGERSRALVCVAERLAGVELYSVLASLEKLYAEPLPAVRRATVEALARYKYKRTFVTLERAIADEDESVAAAARGSLQKLCFDHAFDPLARIHRSTSGANRAAALQALAQLDIPDAAELVLGILAHGGKGERAEALRALSRTRGKAIIEAAERAYPTASARLRESIATLFRARGVSLPAD